VLPPPSLPASNIRTPSALRCRAKLLDACCFLLIQADLPLVQPLPSLPASNIHTIIPSPAPDPAQSRAELHHVCCFLFVIQGPYQQTSKPSSEAPSLTLPPPLALPKQQPC
jgi:hypothetical protein